MTWSDEDQARTLRALGDLVGSLTAKRETSNLSEDPVAMVTAGLAERPVYRCTRARGST